MDIDAHDKHIRALLADNAEIKAFRAWATPILLALEQGAALIEEEIEEQQSAPDEGENIPEQEQLVGEEQPAPVDDEASTAEQSEPESVEEAAPVTDEASTESALVEVEQVSEDEPPPPAAA